MSEEQLVQEGMGAVQLVVVEVVSDDLANAVEGRGGAASGVRGSAVADVLVGVEVPETASPARGGPHGPGVGALHGEQQPALRGPGDLRQFVVPNGDDAKLVVDLTRRPPGLRPP